VAVTLPLPAGDANNAAARDCCLALARCGIADDCDNSTDKMEAAIAADRVQLVTPTALSPWPPDARAAVRPPAATAGAASAAGAADGRRRAHRRLRQLGHRTPLAVLAVMDAREFDDARREIGKYMVGEIQDDLDGQKLFDRSAMPRSKAAIARLGETLIGKHHLYDSYVYQLAGGGVEVGSALVYAAIHHFGGETGKGKKIKLPARPVIGIGER
jgi:phage gpG-like protein